MPYYITKEIINKQISNIFVNGLASTEVINKIENDLINQTFLVPFDVPEMEKMELIKFNENDVVAVVDLLSQVKDYKFYLKYILKIFLFSKHYNEICVFFNKIFVNHIGDEHYVSKDANYDFGERYFDRFIEAVKFSEIDNFKILPFLFKIYSSEKSSILNKYYRPCKEYLKYFIIKNEGTFLKYINTEQNYFVGYKIYCDIFPVKGAKKLIENVVNENYFNKDDVNKLFKLCGQTGIEEINNYIISATNENQRIALNFYLNFGGDIKASLPELYSKVENAQIKSMIKDEIDLSKSEKFETVKDFVEYATLVMHDKTIPNISTKYLTYLKNGAKASDEVISYVFSLFKNITSPLVINKYKFLLDFFTQNEIDNLGFNLINNLGGKIDNENKWVAALVSALCSNLVVSKLVEIVPTCLVSLDLSEFVLGAISQTTCNSAVSLIKQLYIESNNKQFYFSFLEILAENVGISPLDYLDEMVSNYGLSFNCTYNMMCNGENLLFEITDNLCVKVKKLSTNSYINITNSDFSDYKNALRLYDDLTYEIMQQIYVFKRAYVLRRMWQPKIFSSNILSNPLLNKIANTLVWGVYKKDVFKRICDLKDINSVEEGYKIALVHPCELKAEELKKYTNKFEPFKQINVKVFVPSNYEFSNKFTTEFNGIAVSDISFNAKIRTFNYKMSINDGVYYFKPFTSANLLVKIEIEKTTHKNISVIGNIKFYNLNLLTYVNNNYIIGNIEPEQIGSISPRVYSYVLNEIYEACYS